MKGSSSSADSSDDDSSSSAGDPLEAHLNWAEEAEKGNTNIPVLAIEDFQDIKNDNKALGKKDENDIQKENIISTKTHDEPNKSVFHKEDELFDKYLKLAVGDWSESISEDDHSSSDIIDSSPESVSNQTRPELMAQLLQSFLVGMGKSLSPPSRI